MRTRCDGEETRRRIIRAACNIFCAKGYRGATHDVICSAAGANKAAINYHFGDKQTLYRTVWQHLLDAADRQHPVTGEETDGQAVSERLETHIRALLNRHFREGDSQQLERLRTLEQVNPTGLVDDIVAAHHAANRQEMLRVLDELLGEHVTRAQVRFYETAVLSLCRGHWAASKPYAQGARTISSTKIEVLARQITQFVLAGISERVSHSAIADK